MQKKSPLWPIVLLCIAGLLAAGAYFFYFDTYHFAVVQPGVLYRMGMRSTRELQNTIRQVHPKTVVCLVTDEEVNDPSKGDFQGEFKVLQNDGIALHRIPMRENQPPTQSQIDEFLHIVADKQNQPVVVHCAQGVVRTGMMVAAYEKNVLGYDKQQSLDAIQIFGKGHQRADVVRQFIQNSYDGPQTLVTSRVDDSK